MLVKILGGTDILAGIVLLMLGLGYHPITYVVWAFAIIMFLKGLFILTGEFIASPIDLASSAFLVLSIFFAIPAFLFWIAAVLVFVKGAFSFF